MFTGIVEEIGLVKTMIATGEGHEIVIEANKIIKLANLGDSIAVNGCCLTVKELNDQSFSAVCVQETMQKTSLGDLKVGSSVNLESSLTLQKPIGGHIVQGHVDGKGEIISKAVVDNGGIIFQIAANAKLLHYVVQKGSVCVHGVSLTVVEVDNEQFSFVMIPHTAKETVLGKMEVGEKVNIEVDILGKYVEKLFR